MLLLESVETLTSRSLTLSLPFVFQLKVSAWEAPQAPSTTPLLAPMTPAAVGAASWAQGACHAYAMPRAPITWCSGASTLSP
eukprot:1160649-Pelagomonas_calceolata.AAC.6